MIFTGGGVDYISQLSRDVCKSSNVSLWENVEPDWKHLKVGLSCPSDIWRVRSGFSNVTILGLGDSHICHNFMFGIKGFARQLNATLDIHHVGGCPFPHDLYTSNDKCKKKRLRDWEKIARDKPDFLILSSSEWMGPGRQLEKVDTAAKKIKNITEGKTRVLFVQDNPRSRTDPSKNTTMGIQQMFLPHFKNRDKRYSRILSKQGSNHYTFVETRRLFCCVHNEKCISYPAVINGCVRQRDVGHLTPCFAEMISNAVTQLLLINARPSNKNETL